MTLSRRGFLVALPALALLPKVLVLPEIQAGATKIDGGFLYQLLRLPHDVPDTGWLVFTPDLSVMGVSTAPGVKGQLQWVTRANLLGQGLTAWVKVQE